MRRSYCLAQWGKDDLAGFERQRNQAGEAVDYAQSWLCVLDSDQPQAEA